MFGRRRLPAELRPALGDDERVVGWAEASAASGRSGAEPAVKRPESRGTDSGAVVATNWGLFLPGRAERLGWHEIHKATWTGHELTIVPAEVVEQREGYAVTADAPARSVALPDPGRLPTVVRTRVTRSVSYSSHHALPGGGGVRVVARRVPGVDGVSWAVRYDQGTDPAAPHVLAATDQLVAAHAAASAGN